MSDVVAGVTGNGVVADRAAQAEQRDIDASTPVVAGTSDATLRLEALRIAHDSGVSPADVVNRADTYINWLMKGNDND